MPVTFFKLVRIARMRRLEKRFPMSQSPCQRACEGPDPRGELWVTWECRNLCPPGWPLWPNGHLVWGGLKMLKDAERHDQTSTPQLAGYNGIVVSLASGGYLNKRPDAAWCSMHEDHLKPNENESEFVYIPFQTAKSWLWSSVVSVLGRIQFRLS